MKGNSVRILTKCIQKNTIRQDTFLNKQNALYPIDTEMIAIQKERNL